MSELDRNGDLDLVTPSRALAFSGSDRIGPLKSHSHALFHRLLNPSSCIQLQHLAGNACVQRLVESSETPTLRHDQAEGAARHSARGGVHLVQKTLGEEALRRYETLDADLAQFALRTADQNTRIRLLEGNPGPLARALSLPLESDGRLSTEAVAAIEGAQQSEYNRWIAQCHANGLTITGRIPKDNKVLTKRIIRAMAAVTNPVTGKSVNPELVNLLDRHADDPTRDREVEIEYPFGGVRLLVKHNLSDRLVLARCQAIAAALERVAAAGFTVPPFRVYLPKWGRSLGVAVHPDEMRVTESGGTARAVFTAPDLFFMSSQTVGNPVAEKVTNPATKLMEYKYLSTALDPSGAGSVAHELGHFLHYTHSRDKFNKLTSAKLKPAAQKIISEQVSQYGVLNAREDVAEIFLGTVYGRTYSGEVMALYRAFGGPEPG